jgi:hypothetical protein
METAKKLVLPVAAVVVIYALTTGDTINEDAQYNWGPPPPHDDNLHVYADSPHGDHTRVLPIRFEGGEKDYSEKFIPGEIVTFMQDSANFQTSKEMNALIQEERREWRNDSKYSPSIAHYSREVIQFLRHNLQVLEDARGNATTSAGVPNHDNLKSLYHKQQKIFFLFGRPNEVGGGIGTLKAELSFHWNRAKHIIDSSDSRESVLLGQDKFRTPFETIEHLEMELREIYVEFNRLGDQYSKINGDIQAVLDEHNFQPQKSNFITRLFQTAPVNDSSLTPEKRVGCMSKVVSNLARCLPKEPVPGEMGTGEVTVTDRVYPENDFAQRKAPQLRSKLRSPNRRGYQKVNTGKVRSAPITKKRTFDVSVAKHLRCHKRLAHSTKERSPRN